MTFLRLIIGVNVAMFGLLVAILKVSTKPTPKPPLTKWNPKLFL